MKTKPTQHSVNELRRIGIQPHALLCRSEQGLDRDTAKIALFASLPEEAVISARDVDNVYKVPLVLRAEGMDDQILDHFGMDAPAPDLAEWEELIKRADASRERKVKIALVGKYVQLEDAYKSVIEALTHGGWQHEVEVETELVSAEDIDEAELEDVDGILIPAGSASAGSRARSRRRGSPARRGFPISGSASGCRSRSWSSRATSAGWTAPTPPSSIRRPRTRSSTCSPSRRRCRTSAGRCGSAPTR